MNLHCFSACRTYMAYQEVLRNVGFTVGKTNTVEHLENILDHLKQTATGDIVASICVIVQRIATDSLTKLTAARSFLPSRMTRLCITHSLTRLRSSVANPTKTKSRRQITEPASVILLTEIHNRGG